MWTYAREVLPSWDGGCVSTCRTKDILGIIKPCHILYNSVIVAPELENTLYITPHLGRCISITHLPELVRQEKQQEETLL